MPLCLRKGSFRRGSSHLGHQTPRLCHYNNTNTITANYWCIELAFAALERPCVKRQMIYTSVMGVALHFTALRVCMCRDTERKPVCAYCRRAREKYIEEHAQFSVTVCVWERRWERKGTHRSVAPLLESLEMLSDSCSSSGLLQGHTCTDEHRATHKHTPQTCRHCHSWQPVK